MGILDKFCAMVGIAGMLTISSVPLSAQTLQQCGNLFDLMGLYATAHGKIFDSFTFQKDDRGDIILLLFKEAPGPTVSKWILLVRRDKDSLNFCVESDGIRFGVLASLHNSNTDKRYGMPGSGQPRCSSHNDVLGSLSVRMWASRELGESAIFYTESDHRSSFDYIISREQNWIVTETKKDTYRTTCYFDRGQNVIIKQNMEWRGAK